MGQMVSALFSVAQRQNPPEQNMVDSINNLTTMMVGYLEHLGWRQRAMKTAKGWVYSKMPQ